jgi:hypothetical protein
MHRKIEDIEGKRTWRESVKYFGILCRKSGKMRRERWIGVK